MSVDEVKLTITFITIVATIVETLFMFIALNIQDLSFLILFVITNNGVV